MTMAVLHAHAGNLYGGVETILVNLLRYAGAAPDVEPRFALCFDGRLQAELRAAGGRLDSLGAVRISRPWTVARARRRLRAILAESADVGVVVCHSAWSQAIFGPVIRAAHVPSVFWLHGAAAGPGWLERWARRTPPDRVICVSRFAAAHLPRLYAGVRYDTVTSPVAPPPAGLSETHRAAIRRSLDIADGQVVIVQVSRVDPMKGQAVLLDALAELRDRTDWACWIVGGAQRRSELAHEAHLRRRASALGVASRVRFLGQRSDVAELLASADLFCQPNTAPEAFGISFVEALYHGLPVVGSRLGATPEIVDGSCGVLVEPGSPRSLAHALAELLDHPERRTALGAGGPARARMLCDPQAQVRRLADLFRDVARGGRNAA